MCRISREYENGGFEGGADEDAILKKNDRAARRGYATLWLVMMASKRGTKDYPR